VSSNQLPTNAFNDGLALELPEFRGLPAIRLDISALQEAEKRAHEAQYVNPSTYANLEHCFGEAYRELKRHLATVGYQAVKAENEFEKSRAIALMDKYQEFMKDKPARLDTGEFRKAYISQDPDVVEAKDRLDSLKALEMFLDGRVRVMENISRYMKKKMDLIIRSGLSGSNLYATSDKK
jgi:hypothetical protein